MIMKYKKKNTKWIPNGFTLIDLIIYISIISVVFIGITYFVTDVYSTQTKSNTKMEVVQNTEYIIGVLNQYIHQAQSITSISNQDIELLNPDASTTIIVIDDLAKNIAIDTGTGSIQFSRNTVEVTGTFTDLSYLTRSRNIGIHLEVRYKNPDNLIDYDSEVIVDTNIELMAK